MKSNSKFFGTACCLILFMLCAVRLYADPVDEKQAMQVAQNFMSQRLGSSASKLIWQDAVSANGNAELYLFVCKPVGFVIVAADDRARPVLAYSTTGTFSTKDIPSNVAAWLDDYAAEIRYLQSNEIAQDEVAHDEWQALMAGSDIPCYASASVSPMLTTTWSQSPYYNDMCPTDSRGDQAVTGCVATAMAQIMKFWNYPTVGTGSHSYHDRTFGTISANFAATTYDWDNMPDQLTSSSSTTQVNAVATLMFHCGVGVEMGYGVDASGAYTYSDNRDYPSVNWALIDYFDYSSDIEGHYKTDYTNSQWISLLKDELSEGRPILYSGSDDDGGHAFVCDGYDASNQFHINWGWDGSCDGYYTIGSLNPGGSGTGGNSTYTFNSDNEAITHIMPNSSVSGFRVSASVNDNNRGSVTGTGTFQLGDTTRLFAQANPGYRFEGWDVDTLTNPFDIVVTQNCSYTANFANLGNDTLHYDNGKVTTLLGSDQSFKWGIRLRATDFRRYSSLVKVMVYDYVAGNYDLLIYQGGTDSPDSLVAQQQVTFTGSRGWKVVDLADTLALNNDEPLWIVISSQSAGYVAAACTYAGNADGSWISYNNTWHNLADDGYYYTWALRAIFANESYSQCLVSDFPYSLTFENDVECWSVDAVDETSSNNQYLGIYEGGSDAYSGDYMFQFCSYYQSTDYNQYLISPEISAPGEMTLSFYYRAPYGHYYTEKFEVLYSTTDNAISSFTNTAGTKSTRSSEWKQFECTVPANAKYIAINYSSDYHYYLFIDDILITAKDPASCIVSKLPWTEDFTTTSATAECWQAADYDDDGNTWGVVQSYQYGYEDSYGFAFSSSYLYTALTPDNWLISPAIVLPAGYEYQLSWAASGFHETDNAEHYGVYISTGTGLSIDEYLSNCVFSETLSSANYVVRTADISRFAGNTIYIAFRHYDCTDQFRLLLDNISVTKGDPVPTPSGINEVQDMSVVIYPNPVANTATVMCDGMRSVDLYDLTGRRLLSQKDNVISLASYPQGTYFAHIYTASGVVVKKIVKL